MSHKHQRTPETIFHNSISGKPHCRDAESLLHHRDARIEPGHGVRPRVVWNGVENPWTHISLDQP